MRILSIFSLLLFLTSCYRASVQIEPNIGQASHPKEIFRETRVPILLPENFSCSPFIPIDAYEEREDWGKEYKIGCVFADDFDLYRAITSFKRALVLLPPESKERRQEIEYSIALAYYLGKKYGEVIYEVESTDLISADDAFPAFSDLLVILYDSYDHMGRFRERDHILSLIEKRDPCSGQKLYLLKELGQANFVSLSEKKNAAVDELIFSYHSDSKSVRKAEFLNAIFPGAGYWYVGQKQTAITAFAVNALFIGTAIAFFEHNNTPAGMIALSLESGWYFGGIYGGGLAAKYYNERLYEGKVATLSEKERLFPLMMLRYSF